LVQIQSSKFSQLQKKSSTSAHLGQSKVLVFGENHIGTALASTFCGLCQIDFIFFQDRLLKTERERYQLSEKNAPVFKATQPKTLHDFEGQIMGKISPQHSGGWTGPPLKIISEMIVGWSGLPTP